MRRLRWSVLVAGCAVGFITAVTHWFLARPYAEPGARAETFADTGHAAERPRMRGAEALPRDISHVMAAAPTTTERRVRKHHTPALTDTKNYLLIGVDRRPGARYGGLADTIIIAVFDESSGHVGLVSIPRDLYVDIPGHGPDRINATLGRARQVGQRPLPLFKRVIEDTLALPIIHALAVDLEVFERAVDALDGISVEVVCPIIDNFIDERTSTGWRRLEVLAGPQHMDGPTAAMYVRSRHGRTDWNRSRRQQAVLLGLRERFLTLDGLTRFPALWAEFETSLVSDMRRIDVFRLVQKVVRTDAQRIHGLVLGDKHAITHRTEDRRAVLLPNYEAINNALSHLFKAPAPGTPPKHAQCEPPDAAIRSKHAKTDSAPAEGG